MQAIFYISAAVAVISTLLVITRPNAVHALLYLILSLLSIAVIFFVLGAPFVAALEVIIYAGAIMVLFVFVIMMLNLGPHTVEQERQWMQPRTWVMPSTLALVLLIELLYMFIRPLAPAAAGAAEVGPKQIGMSLMGPYVLGLELASMLLLAGLVGAYHLGRRDRGGPGDEGHRP